MPSPHNVRALLVSRLHALLAELAECDGLEVQSLSASDDFLEVYLTLRPRGPAMSGRMSGDNDLTPPDARQDNLGEMERCLLAAIGQPGERVMTAREIGERAGYPYNSHLRTVLSSLCRRGYLRSGQSGYVRLMS